MITATELRRQKVIYTWHRLINRLFRKPRYFVARLLNKHTTACWGDLVMWAEFGGLELPELNHQCQPGGHGNDLPTGCYCGKFSTHHRRVGMVGEDD